METLVEITLGLRLEKREHIDMETCTGIKTGKVGTQIYGNTTV
jgi:hypothetical protein